MTITVTLSATSSSFFSYTGITSPALPLPVPSQIPQGRNCRELKALPAKSPCTGRLCALLPVPLTPAPFPLLALIGGHKENRILDGEG